jgi:hypothetical protein
MQSQVNVAHFRADMAMIGVDEAKSAVENRRRFAGPRGTLAR